MLPGSTSIGGRGKRSKSGQRQRLPLSTEQEFPHWLARGLILRGWALVEQGQGEEGIAQMRQGLSRHRATGAELLGDRIFLPCWPKGYGKAGQTEEGLSCIGRGAGWGEQNWGASLRGGAVSAEGRAHTSVQGKFGQIQEVHSHQPPIPNPNPQAQAEAEDCFLRAIEIAQKQQAKSLGTARHDEPRPAMANTRQAARSTSTRCPRSTIGSPKALTRKICKRRRRS